MPLAILLSFHWWYITLYCALSTGLFIYKGLHLFYPSQSLTWDVLLLVAFVCNESVRLKFLIRGNKTGSVESLVKGSILSLLAIVLLSYFIKLQTWILKMDEILNAIGLVGGLLHHNRGKKIC